MKPEKKNTTQYQYKAGAETIEQWYTDSYDRDDPNGPAPEALRRHNLVNAMTNHGFSQNRAWTIVNWLMRCKGFYRDFDDRSRRGKSASRRAKSRQKDEASVTTTVEPEVLPESNGNEFDRATIVGTVNSTVESTDTADTESEEGTEVMPTDEEIKALLGFENGGGEEPTPPVSSQGPSEDDSQYMHTLQRRLRFFDIVYGDQLAPDNPKLTFDYTKGPFPRAIKSRRTQGLRPVVTDTTTNVHGIVCDSEDLTNGLFVPRPSDRATAAEAEEYDKLLKHQLKKCEEKARLEWTTRSRWSQQRELNVFDRCCATITTPSFSDGYRETWKGARSSGDVVGDAIMLDVDATAAEDDDEHE